MKSRWRREVRELGFVSKQTFFYLSLSIVPFPHTPHTLIHSKGNEMVANRWLCFVSTLSHSCPLLQFDSQRNMFGCCCYFLVSSVKHKRVYCGCSLLQELHKVGRKKANLGGPFDLAPPPSVLSHL